MWARMYIRSVCMYVGRYGGEVCLLRLGTGLFLGEGD